VLEDEVTNLGDRPAALMLLYHINLGWPVVDEHSQLFGWPHIVRPRPGDRAAKAAMGEHDRFERPVADWPSQVFEHVGLSDNESLTVGVINPKYTPTDGVAVAVTYSAQQLPRLWRWRMFGRRTYLLSVEPATCSLDGRDAARRAGETIAVLAPGESRQFRIEFTVGVGDDARRMAKAALDRVDI
jgi:hypothetical protein